MTERSQGAPNPDKSVERPLSGAVPPETGGASRASGVSPDADPPLEQPVPLARDIHAVRRTDALIDALGGRRSSGSDPGLSHDPAFSLLQALLKDVNEPSAARPLGAGGTPGGTPGDGDRPPAPPGPPRGPRRRGSRTIVALGVAGAVLATTGVAAAGPSEPSALEQDAAGPVEDISKSSVTGPTDASMAVLADGAPPARRPSSPIGDRPGKAADAGETEDTGDRKAEPRRSSVARAPIRHGEVPYRTSRTGRVGLSVATSREGPASGDGSDGEQDEASRAGDSVQTWGLRFPPTRPWGGNRR